MSLRPVVATATRASPPRASATFLLYTRPYVCPGCLYQQQQQRIIPPRRWLHATQPRRQEEDFATKNHYQRLGLRYDASPPEIKKSFYTLSKTHHPDTSPLPNAAHTFSLLSESYTLLSDPRRRAAYDRDVLRLHSSQDGPAAGAKGSYSSTASAAAASRAGGRPASGLSRRRGTFRGPPPSFYRSGGWGAHATKRRAAHEESTSGAGQPQSSTNNASPRSGTAGGMGPGARYPNEEEEDVPPHFDKAGHRRTQGRQDDRRWQRARRAMGDDGVEFEPQMSLGAHFLVVGAILVATVMVPMAYLNTVRSGRKREAG